MKNLLLLFALISFTIGNITAQCTISSTITSVEQNCKTFKFTANTLVSNSTTSILGYFWDFGDGQTSTSQSPTHTYSANTGNFTVTVTVVGFNRSTGDCCTDNASKNITINCNTNCSINITGIYSLSGGGSNFVFVVPLQLGSSSTLTSSFCVVTYQSGNTYSSAGTINSWGTSFNVPVSCTNKITRIRVTAYANGGVCSDTEIKIYPSGVCGGGILQLSPNPAQSMLNINIDEKHFEANNKFEAMLYDLNGTLKERIQLNNEQNNRVDVSTMKNGIYMIKLLENGKIIDSQKLIINN